MSGPGAVRVSLVGPTHPWKGGVAQHTTQLGLQLRGRGNDAAVVSWSAQYPRWLYPGEARVPAGSAAGAPGAPGAPTTYPLSWARPASWWRTGRELASREGVVLVLVTPVQVPAYLGLLAGLRSRRFSRRSQQVGDGCGPRVVAPRVVALCHNVVPHERRPGDRALVARLLRLVDAALVHTEEQATAARALSPEVPVAVAGLPAHFTPPAEPGLPPDRPVEDPPPRELPTGEPTAGPRRLLFFGLVRPYKGLDVLLAALRGVPQARLTVAGEFWGDALPDAQRSGHALGERLELRPGFVPDEALPGLFATHDAVVLPYRCATASQNARLAHAYGLPVVATRVGSFVDDVRDGVDGLLVPPDDAEALAAALRSLAHPDCWQRLREGARRRAGEVAAARQGEWERYCATLEQLLVAAPQPTLSPSARATGAPPARNGRRW